MVIKEAILKMDSTVISREGIEVCERIEWEELRRQLIETRVGIVICMYIL